MNLKKFFFVFFISFSVYCMCANPVSLYEKGMLFQQKGDWYSAIENYQEAIRLNPSYSDVYRRLAECFYALDEYSQALQQITIAENFRKNDPEILSLKGFIFIGLQQLPEATTLFNRVLVSWPNSISARFGLAEIDLYAGRISSAASYYQQAVDRSPENKKALVSLAILSQEMGNTSLAQEYIQRALRVYSDNPDVLYYSAFIASRSSNFEVAEKQLRAALVIHPQHDPSKALLTNILYKSDRLVEVLEIIDQRISLNRNKSDAWYLKTITLGKLGRIEDALKTAEVGLQISPNDEMYRSFVENIIIENLPLEDTRRKNYASWHFQRAKLFEQKNMSDQALYEYRRALKINPYDPEIRTSYASVLRTRGYFTRHLEQLEFLQNLGLGTTAVNDAVESYRKLLSNSVENMWKINSLYLDKAHTSIGVYYLRDATSLFHPDAESISSQMLAEVFSYDLRFSISAQSKPVSSYADAFRISRGKGEQYFILLQIEENERDMQMVSTMYVSSTGSKANEYQVFRTGNDRFANSLRRMVQLISASLPVKGKILNRHQSTALIDLGKADGISVDNLFEIVSKNDIRISPEGIGLTYPPSSILGKIKITRVGEDVSEGIIERNGFFDRVNPNDMIILSLDPENETKTEKNESTEYKGFPILLDLIRKIQ